MNRGLRGSKGPRGGEEEQRPSLSATKEGGCIKEEGSTKNDLQRHRRSEARKRWFGGGTGGNRYFLQLVKLGMRGKSGQQLPKKERDTRHVYHKSPTNEAATDTCPPIPEVGLRGRETGDATGHLR